jgi:two-component system sensor histidine kinase PilS (NtrC family)
VTSGAAAVLTSEDERLAWRRRLSFLMVGRLVVATLLLGGSLLVHIQDRATFTTFTSRTLLALIIGTYAVSVLFAVWLPRARSYPTLAAAQIGWDLILATGLVYVTLGADSVFASLYGMTILAAALVAGQRASNATGVASLILYVVVGIGQASGYVDTPPDQPATRYRLAGPDLGLAALRNVLGLLVVTALAGALAERLRRARGQLQQATASAARFEKLNDDIVRSLTSGLLTTDATGQVVTINPAGVEMFRLPEAALVGRAITELLPVDVARAAETRGEGEAARPDGTRFPVGWTRTPLVSQEGGAGTLVVFQDLTQIRELEAAAERQERLAALGRVAASMAHEIRNPLGSISGSVELVRESQKLDDEERRLLGIVSAEVERLDDLVTTILDLTKPRAAEKAELDLGRIADEVAEMVRNGPAFTQSISVRTEIPAAVPTYADEAQVRQMLWNLIKNAVQVSNRGTTVTVAARRGENGEAIVEVRDRGPGVDAQARERMFDMFWSGRSHGIGLGLSLVKQIVDTHGGRIDVEAQEGGGSVFRVTLPEQRESRPNPRAVSAAHQ